MTDKPLDCTTSGVGKHDVRDDDPYAIRRAMHSWQKNTRSVGTEAAPDVVELVEDAEVWIRSMREAVNSPNPEWFFLDARLQNLEAWLTGAKRTLSTLPSPVPPSAGLDDLRKRFQLETLRTSEQSALLRRASDYLKAHYSCPAIGSNESDCCRIVREIDVLLERPINDQQAIESAKAVQPSGDVVKLIELMNKCPLSHDLREVGTVGTVWALAIQAAIAAMKGTEQ